MIRFKAINDVESDQDKSGLSSITKEKEESNARNMYERALHLQSQNKYTEALYAYNDLVKLESIRKIRRDDSQNLNTKTSVFLYLKYLAYKNMAPIYEQMNYPIQAVKCLCKALSIDDSDVTVWYQLARVSFHSCDNYPLCRRALESALARNSNHALSASMLCEVLFVIGDFQSCIEQAHLVLEREPMNQRMQCILSECTKSIYDAPFVDEVNKKTLQDLYARINKLSRQLTMSGEIAEEDAEIIRIKELDWDAFANDLNKLYKSHVKGNKKANPLLRLERDYDQQPIVIDDEDDQNMVDFGDDDDMTAADNTITTNNKENNDNSSNKNYEEKQDTENTMTTNATTTAVAENTTDTSDALMPAIEEARSEQTTPHAQGPPSTPDQQVMSQKKRSHQGEGSAGERRQSKRLKDQKDVSSKGKVVVPTETTDKRRVDFDEFIRPFIGYEDSNTDPNDNAAVASSVSDDNDKSNKGAEAELSEVKVLSTEELKNFINSTCEQQNPTLIDTMLDFTKMICRHYNMKWPGSLASMVRNFHNKLRVRHEQEYFSAMDTVCIAELLMDRYLENPARWKNYIATARAYLHELNMDFICGHDSQNEEEIPKEELAILPIRVLWLMGHIEKAYDRPANAIKYFSECKQQLASIQSEPKVVHLPNCKYLSIISEEKLERQFLELDQLRAIDQAQALLAEQKWDEMFSALEPLLNSKFFNSSKVTELQPMIKKAIQGGYLGSKVLQLCEHLLRDFDNQIDKLQASLMEEQKKKPASGAAATEDKQASKEKEIQQRESKLKENKQMVIQLLRTCDRKLATREDVRSVDPTLRKKLLQHFLKALGFADRIIRVDDGRGGDGAQQHIDGAGVFIPYAFKLIYKLNTWSSREKRFDFLQQSRRRFFHKIGRKTDKRREFLEFCLEELAALKRELVSLADDGTQKPRRKSKAKRHSGGGQYSNNNNNNNNNEATEYSGSDDDEETHDEEEFEKRIEREQALLIHALYGFTIQDMEYYIDESYKVGSEYLELKTKSQAAIVFSVLKVIAEEYLDEKLSLAGKRRILDHLQLVINVFVKGDLPTVVSAVQEDIYQFLDSTDTIIENPDVSKLPVLNWDGVEYAEVYQDLYFFKGIFTKTLHDSKQKALDRTYPEWQKWVDEVSEAINCLETACVCKPLEHRAWKAVSGCYWELINALLHRPILCFKAKLRGIDNSQFDRHTQFDYANPEQRVLLKQCIDICKRRALNAAQVAALLNKEDDVAPKRAGYIIHKYLKDETIRKGSDTYIQLAQRGYYWFEHTKQYTNPSDAYAVLMMMAVMKKAMDPFTNPKEYMALLKESFASDLLSKSTHAKNKKLEPFYCLQSARLKLLMHDYLANEDKYSDVVKEFEFVQAQMETNKNFKYSRKEKHAYFETVPDNFETITLCSSSSSSSGSNITNKLPLWLNVLEGLRFCLKVENFYYKALYKLTVAVFKGPWHNADVAKRIISVAFRKTTSISYPPNMWRYGDDVGEYLEFSHWQAKLTRLYLQLLEETSDVQELCNVAIALQSFTQRQKVPLYELAVQTFVRTFERRDRSRPDPISSSSLQSPTISASPQSAMSSDNGSSFNGVFLGPMLKCAQTALSLTNNETIKSKFPELHEKARKVFLNEWNYYISTTALGSWFSLGNSQSSFSSSASSSAFSSPALMSPSSLVTPVTPPAAAAAALAHQPTSPQSPLRQATSEDEAIQLFTRVFGDVTKISSISTTTATTTSSSSSSNTNGIGASPMASSPAMETSSGSSTPTPVATTTITPSPTVTTSLGITKAIRKRNLQRKSQQQQAPSSSSAPAPPQQQPTSNAASLIAANNINNNIQQQQQQQQQQQRRESAGAEEVLVIDDDDEQTDATTELAKHISNIENAPPSFTGSVLEFPAQPAPTATTTTPVPAPAPAAMSTATATATTTATSVVVLDESDTGAGEVTLVSSDSQGGDDFDFDLNK